MPGRRLPGVGESLIPRPGTPLGGDLNLAGPRHVLVPAGQISIGKLIVLIEDSRASRESGDHVRSLMVTLAGAGVAGVLVPACSSGFTAPGTGPIRSGDFQAGASLPGSTAPGSPQAAGPATVWLLAVASIPGEGLARQRFTSFLEA